MTPRHPLDGNAIAADEYYNREDGDQQEQDEMGEDDYLQTWRGSRSRYQEDEE